ncbi:AraC family transcriptional regulator [Pedobacter sp. HMWF019]|uniref:helix-turn-helix domain-containing protein n=1 Tax=Pedobacter sp. HMWF019 TaxID=2056856 RepID=UPI000D36CAE2|nr:AraC family transcriptional regulator [Pedobacter sp. HMWF019]PTT00228.1 AraC family transcriptional regulator [Pedobacter sp. HMWF019]
MDHQITIFNTIILVGMLQGMIGLICWIFRPNKNSENNLLVLIILVLILLSFKILLHTFGLWQYPGWRYFPLAIDTTIQPLFYLYTCSVTTQHYLFSRKKLLHFIPTMFFLCHAFIVYIATAKQEDFLLKDLIAESFFYNQLKFTEDVVAILASIIYWFLSFRRVENYRKWLFKSQSDTGFAELSWLRNLLICTGLLIVFLFISSLTQNIMPSGRDYFVLTQFFYIYLSITTFYLAYRIIIFPQHDQFSSIRQATSVQPAKSLAVDKTINYRVIQQAIYRAFEVDKLFLNPQLSLKELSIAIGFPLNQVSGAINYGSNHNFRDLVNKYRIEEVKKRLADPENKRYSLTGIAFDCGFNSEASFYRIFRQQTGCSPKNYFSSKSN